MRQFILILSTLLAAIVSAQNQKISLTVTEKATHEPVVMGTIMLEPSGQSAVTDLQGQAIISNGASTRLSCAT